MYTFGTKAFINRRIFDKSWDTSTNIIIGATPGHHIPFYQFFPNRTFYLYDPRDFAIEETDNILIFQKYFELNDVQI